MAIDSNGGGWDPGKHPRGPGGKFARLAGHMAGVTVMDKREQKGMTDDQFTARGRRVEQVIGDARKTHSTELTQTTPAGTWRPARDRLHRELADELYAKAAHVPNNGEAVIAGGLGGAGKTTTLKGHAGIDPGNYLNINPDDIKEELAARGVIPDVPGAADLSPMERAALVHEESSRIAKLLAEKAYRDRKNVMWDITMSSESSVASRVDDMRGAGYGKITGVFVDIPVEVSVSRAMARYRRGVDDYHNGKGYGGRFVPPAVIRAQRSSSGGTVNRETFDKMRGTFDAWSVFDNSVDGRAPQRIAASDTTPGR